MLPPTSRRLALLLSLLGLTACTSKPPVPVPAAPPVSTAAETPPAIREGRVPPTKYRGQAPAPRPEILDARCGTCHSTPGPELLPVSGWEYLVPKMAENIVTYELGAPIVEAEQQELLRYYVTNAPERLEPLELDFAPGGPSFEPTLLAQPPIDWRTLDTWPFIANVNVVDLDANGRPDVLACDVQSNLVTWFAPGPQGWQEHRLAQMPAPAHAEPLDIDGDGDLDVLAAVLGSGRPTDEPVGSVVLLINEAPRGFRVEMVASDLPRVADARPGDFDGDGDLDIVAAIFGGWTVGRLVWFEQVAPLQFVEHLVHEANGGIHVPVEDIDGDGDLDFFAVVSQHHEEVLAFLNDGSGHFEARVLWKAPHPLWGSSGITPADLDGDGDTDLVYTNGDAHDMDVAAKPYHGVQWLENRGGLEFVYHDITRLYGAYGSSTGDLDGDGDLDIVVTSQLNEWADDTAESLIWLENDGSGAFTRRLIARFPHELVTSAIADLNFDGKADVLTGAMHLKPPGEIVSRVTLWLQR
jgi:hypothetical protein